MAKKNFTGGLGSLLKKTTETDDVINEQGQGGNSETISNPEVAGFTERRATFIVREDYLDKINGIAYWERTMQKDQLNAALGAYIEQYEKINGEIKVAPKKPKK